MLHCFLLTDTIPYICADRDSRKKCTWVSSSPCFFMKWKTFGNPTWHRLLGKCPGKLGSRGTCGSFSFCELWMWALLTFCLLGIRTAWWPNVASFLILKIYSQSTFVFAISVILFFFERSHQFSSRKLFFEIGGHYIKPQPIKIQGHRAQSQWIHSPHTRSPMVQKTGQKDYKWQRVSEFSVRFCLLITSEATLWTSHEYDCLKMSWKKMALIDIPQGKAHKPSDLQKELQEPKGWWEQEK